MEKPFKILAVDDETISLELIATIFEDEYEVITTRNGRDALRLIREESPDLILLDVLMPALSGFEICAQIKTDETLVDIPIIFLTGLNTNQSALYGLELGGIDYVTKPYEIPLFKLRVRNHLALKERTDIIKAQRDQLTRQKEELEAALLRIKKLEGIVPICMYCKKIRSDQQSWQMIEQYISEHSEAQFSHGICPECMAEQLKIVEELK